MKMQVGSWQPKQTCDDLEELAKWCKGGLCTKMEIHWWLPN